MAALLLFQAIAQASTQREGSDKLPIHVVRFTLELSADTGNIQERVEKLAGTKTPPLVPLDVDLPEFLILQFLDVPRSISIPALFDIANLLQAELGLRSCTPDIGASGLEASNSDDISTESVLADPLLTLTCKTRKPDPEHHDWAARSIGATDLWAKSKGAGIAIAQPDTGIAAHPAIDAGVDKAKAYDVMADRPGATDPLRPKSGNPGHGTATCSVIVGQGDVSGIAPEAKVIPIRTIESVVVLDGAPIARAIMRAIHSKAHIITMSLGGLFISPSLRAALKAAVDANIIVCAAAGNCVQPIVVYPASDRNAHAIAGINAWDEPWIGSSRGSKVAFSAPAEKVFVARRAPNDGGNALVEPSEGTSYATAATAGAAALWLATHGRDAVINEARSRQISVHRLFLLAATSTVRPPAAGVWDRRYGAGILDVARMAAQPLSSIPSALPQMEAVQAEPDEQTRSLIEVMDLAGEPEVDASFDWHRFGAEAVHLASDAWRRRQANQAVFVESALRPEPSEALKAAGLPPALERALAPSKNEPLVQPPLPRGHLEDSPELASPVIRLREDAEPRGVVLSEATRRRVDGISPKHLLDNVEKAFSRYGEADAPSLENRAWALDRAERALSAHSIGDAHLPFEHAMVLEAIVRLNDRPTYLVEGGAIAIGDDEEWGGQLQVFEVKRFAASVGRVNLDGGHVGTGSVVAPGVIMTNRHVLEALAEEVKGPAGSRWIFSRGVPSIDFSDAADGLSPFRICEVIAAGSTPTSGQVVFTTLDMVLLDVETQNDAGLTLPKRLPLAGASDVSGANGTEIVTMGYPARPSTASMRDPNTGQFRQDVMKRLQQLFGLKYGRKYLAPGQIDQIRGKPSGDTNAWVFAHEATTLGGNSGSPVAALSELAVHGLHFAGATLVDNYAHSLNAVRNSGVLPKLGEIDAQWV